MHDDELRALVREAVRRHLGSGIGEAAALDRTAVASHASHGRLHLPSGGDGDGSCLIEPAVECTHCGFCQSFGH